MLALAPFALPLYVMTLLTEALILGLFAMSLDLMVGYTRLFSFGHAAAFGFGAYASGWLLLHTQLPMLCAVPLAALLAGIVAIGAAWVCTQATGVSFSMLILSRAGARPRPRGQFRRTAGPDDRVGCAHREGCGQLRRGV